MHSGGYIWLGLVHIIPVYGPGCLCEAPTGGGLPQEMIYGCSFSVSVMVQQAATNESEHAGTQRGEPVGGVGGAGNVILEYGMTPNTQHLETLSDGRVGSASFNLSQCKVILLWLPGAYPRAQTHTNRFIRWHMVILVKECVWCFIYNWFLISRYVDNRFIGLCRQNIPFSDSKTARWKLFTRNTAQRKNCTKM